MIEKLNEFRKLQQQKNARQIPVQTEWAKVKSVDWEEKTMTVVSEANGLDYEDVLLGLGSHYCKPVPGCLALIGMIDNSAACFLIDCEEVEEIEVTDKSGFKWHLNDGLLTINGNEYSIVKAEELQSVMDTNANFIDAFKQALNSPVNEPGNGSPSAFQQALKGALASKDWGDHSEIKNETIKHGNGQ